MTSTARFDLPSVDDGRLTTTMVVTTFTPTPTLLATLVTDRSLTESHELGAPAWSVSEHHEQLTPPDQLAHVLLKVTWVSDVRSTRALEPTVSQHSITQVSQPVTFVTADAPTLAPAATSYANNDSSPLGSNKVDDEDLELPIDTAALNRVLDALIVSRPKRLLDDPIGNDALRKVLLLEGVRQPIVLPTLTEFSLPAEWDSEVEARLQAAEAAQQKQPKQPAEKTKPPKTDGEPTPESDSEKKRPPKMAEAAPEALSETAGPMVAARLADTPQRSWWEALTDPQVWLANVMAITTCITAWPNKRERRANSALCSPRELNERTKDRI